MSYLALYRRYRPDTFENLIGQDHIVKTLVNQIKGDRLGHAYLFTGIRGTGKTSAAKIFAKAINCLSPINGSPCGKCEACRAIADPSNIDVVEIDAASNNGVNEIRDLREKVQYPPVSCKYKVYIVDEVHMLTGAAFNALLKTLEEPPKHAVFILATTEVYKIPATILSRCMRFDFRLVSPEQIAELIAKIYVEQGKEYEEEAIFAIAKAGEGSIRDALSIADIAISYNNGKLTYSDVMEILGATDDNLIMEFIGCVAQGDKGKVLNIINKLSGLGKSMGVLTKDVTGIIRDLIVVKTCENANAILTLPTGKFEEYKRLASTVSEDKLIYMLEIFSGAENLLRYTNHPRVVFETVAIKATRPELSTNVDALLARIKNLEEKIENLGDIKKNKTLEKLVEQPTNNIGVQQEKKEKVRISIQECSAKELKGKLLFNLRKNGSEMLWNMLQNIDVEISGNVLSIMCKTDYDQELLNSPTSKKAIEEALGEFIPFELQVKLTDVAKSLEAVEEASERIKKIFGDDIVIIK